METLLKVLLVEDSEDDALLILRELRRGGYHPLHEQVETEKDMRDALSLKEWDIILSDFNMPHFSALGALTVLKESGFDVPFIIVSGAIGEENAVQLMREGAHDYIMKDHLQRLVPVIKRELEEAAGRKSRRKAEDLYRKSDFIVNSSNDMMALVNRNYVYETVNKSFYKAFKKSSQHEIVGNRIGDVWWGKEVYETKIKNYLDRVFKGEEINTEKCFNMPEEGLQWYEINCSPYTNNDGNITHAVIVMHNITSRKITEKKLDEGYQQLQKTMMETVHALSALVEMRDPYTAGHQNRVAKIAQAIAKKMNLPDDRIQGILVASMIHDVGKISVPSDILSKPGRLSEVEFELVKQHPKTGYEILKGIDFAWPVAEIVLQHHEKMDGSGYPQGLKGEEIILESRIITVADVVEAMGFHRPYREALGLDAALEEIRNNRGILYDPQVVDACLEIFLKEGFELV